MKWRILSTEQSEDWYNALGHFSKSDIYFLPEYHRAYEMNGDGKAYAFLAEEGDHIMFYPFFIRPIEKVGSEPMREGWYDIETVYGYSGPLCTTTDSTFLAEVWSVFTTWCQESHIIAEFVRFNPMVGNCLSMDPAFVIRDRDTVMVNLNCSEKELWEGYPSVQRNMVRKAMKMKMVCERIAPTDGLSVFKGLYRQTMDRIKAEPYYNFSDAYFNHLINTLSKSTDLFIVQYENQVVAAALLLINSDRIHYHLAGSDEHYRKYAPNNLLLHTVAQWGHKNGFRCLHLGGGRTAAPDDDLFRFKASISRLRLPFYIGKRVHNQDVYERLCAEWMRQKNVRERPNYFLLYRLEKNE